MAIKDDFSNADTSERLWRDRRRILGLPISFTVYTVDRQRLTCKEGLFNTEINELLIYRILDIKMTRTLGQKILGVGTIVLYSADQTSATFEIRNIKKPDAVRKFLSKLVEYERTQKGLVGREIYGAAGAAAAFANDGAVPPSRPPYVDLDGDGIPD